MLNTAKFYLQRMLHRLTQNWVYTARSGHINGLKRRGGLGFLPFRSLPVDELFLASLDFQDKTVYDVGGFIGLMTLFFARAVGNKGQVVTFEPVPIHQQAILDHVQLNNFDNVRLMPFGLGDSPQSSEFIYCADDPAYSTAHPQRVAELYNREDAQVMQIEIHPLDQVIKAHQLPQPAFIKLDVEGMEWSALMGMQATIQAFQPDLFIELHGSHNQQIAQYLLKQGYRIWQVRDGVELTENNLEQARRFLFAYTGDAPSQLVKSSITAK